MTPAVRKQRGAFGHEADAQQEEEERRQNRHMRAGNHQRVKRAGVAVILGPHALKLVILADQDRLHHGGLIRVACVHARDAGERGGAQIHDELLKRRAAMAGQNADRAGGAGGGPIDVALRQVVRVIECARIAVIVRLADRGIEFDVLPVAQVGQRFAVASVERDLRARFRFEFEHEALARAGDRRRLDHASAENDDFARFGIDFGRRTAERGLRRSRRR